HERLLQAFGQALGQRTRCDVGRAACRPWHDHGHVAGRPVLGEGAGGEDGCCQGEDEGFSFGREDSHGFVTYIVDYVANYSISCCNDFTRMVMPIAYVVVR